MRTILVSHHRGAQRNPAITAFLNQIKQPADTTSHAKRRPAAKPA
jgi:hypothetical protein